MGWMHDTLAFMARDPMYRGWHLDEISFGLVYAWSENFVLPLSHDEVVHGKRSLLGRMPGNDDARFASLRLLFGLMFAHPGKKLLFAGDEFGQVDEWKSWTSLDWHIAREPRHAGLQRLVGDCNRAYRERPALHERDATGEGFEWVVLDDAQNGVVAWIRYDAGRRNHVVGVANFSGIRHDGYRLGVPHAGTYAEILNTDSAIYGGGNEGNLGAVATAPVPMHGRPQSLSITLPPLAFVMFAP
jgi:1,4-alpha-glucan branching enzyme